MLEEIDLQMGSEAGAKVICGLWKAENNLQNQKLQKGFVNWPVFGEMYSSLCQIPHWFSKEGPLGIAYTRLFYVLDALPVTQQTVSKQ